RQRHGTRTCRDLRPPAASTLVTDQPRERVQCRQDRGGGPCAAGAATVDRRAQHSRDGDTMSTMADLDQVTQLAALELAVRAPSIHNSQPWRFGVGPGRIELYADPTRHLAATDPDERDLLISCGAALHHLRIGLAALGWL